MSASSPEPRRSRARPFVVAALASIVILTLVALGRDSGSTEIVVAFEQAHGLVEGAEVRSAGFDVGRVTEIELGPDRRPRVTMRIRDGFGVRQGTTADLRLFSLAGVVNRFVDLHNGTGARLPDGAVIRGRDADEPVELDQVLSTLDPATRSDVRGLLHGLQRSSDGRGPDIENALRRSADTVGETAELLAGLRGDGDALDLLLRRSRTVVGTLAADPDASGAAIDALANTLDVTAARQDELRNGLLRLPAGLRSPRLALDRTRRSVADLRGVVRDARPAVESLIGLSPRLRATLAAARPALEQAERLVRTAPADLKALRPLLRTATPVLNDLAPVLAAANPMLDQIRVRLPDAFSFFANWADFTANYDANGHAARIGLVFAPPPLDSRGPSDTAAGHLQAPFSRTPGVLEGEPWADFEDSFVGSAP